MTTSAIAKKQQSGLHTRAVQQACALDLAIKTLRSKSPPLTPWLCQSEGTSDLRYTTYSLYNVTSKQSLSAKPKKKSKNPWARRSMGVSPRELAFAALLVAVVVLIFKPSSQDNESQREVLRLRHELALCRSKVRALRGRRTRPGPKIQPLNPICFMLCLSVMSACVRTCAGRVCECILSMRVSASITVQCAPPTTVRICACGPAYC